MRLTPNKKAPFFAAESISGKLISLESSKSKKILIKFHRFAGCPVCQWQIHEFEKQQSKLTDAGVETVVFMHSTRDKIVSNFKEVPGLHIIADPQKKYYHLYHSEFLWNKVFSIGTWYAICRAFLQGYFPHFNKFQGGIVGVPSDFLLNENGTITKLHYGRNFGDSWSVPQVLKEVQSL